MRIAGNGIVSFSPKLFDAKHRIKSTGDKGESVVRLTGAIVKLAIAAKGTFEKVLVLVAVVLVTWINAVGTTFSPPPEHEENPKKSMNDCWPLASSTTLPFAEGRISE